VQIGDEGGEVPAEVNKPGLGMLGEQELGFTCRNQWYLQ